MHNIHFQSLTGEVFNSTVWWIKLSRLLGNNLCLSWFITTSPGHSSQSSPLSSPLFNSTVVISFPLSTTATSSTVNFLTFYLMYLSTISALRLSSVLRSRNLLDCLSLLCLALECVRNLLDCLSLLCLALECVRNLLDCLLLLCLALECVRNLQDCLSLLCLALACVT